MNLPFSSALTFLKGGDRVARTGWNGKGMYLYLVPANRYAPTTDAGREIAAKHEDGLVPYGAYLAMKTAQDDVVPWLASQTDILAEDWMILNDDAVVLPRRRYDAELHGWVKSYWLDHSIYYGTVYRDDKSRFRDGEKIRTSRAISVDGDILTTKNTRYLLVDRRD